VADATAWPSFLSGETLLISVETLLLSAETLLISDEPLLLLEFSNTFLFLIFSALLADCIKTFFGLFKAPFGLPFGLGAGFTTVPLIMLSSATGAVFQ